MREDLNIKDLFETTQKKKKSKGKKESRREDLLENNCRSSSSGKMAGKLTPTRGFKSQSRPERNLRTRGRGAWGKHQC